MTELLPCPFCGGIAERVDNGPTKEQVQHAISWGQDYDDGGSFIRCTKCDAATAIHFDRKENLYSSWNDREKSVQRERDAISDRARYIASQYPQGSDGRNTFILLAEWIEARS